jgi:hypothetical protein
LKAGCILITTFGFDDKKIQSAMRMLAYDKLVLVTGKDSIEKESYKRLHEVESSGSNEMETVVVDVFDFMDCLKGIEDVIDKYTKRGSKVIVNFSGGTKVLSDAALLASFQKGIKSYHCEDVLIELPVIKNLPIQERLTDMQRKVLKKIKGDIERREFEQMLVEEGNPLSSVQKAIRELKKMELLDVTVKNGEMYLSGNEAQRYLAESLPD